MGDGVPARIGRFGPVEWIDETASTNDDVAAAARDGTSEGLVIVADHQHQGRGRQGRRFESPAGVSLLASVLLRPQFPPAYVSLVPLAVGLAAVDACRGVVTARVGLKWPNDVLIGPDDRKVAGILVESVVVGAAVEAVVAGIGLNANWRGRFPPELRSRAASLDELAGGPVDRRALLVAFLGSLDGWYGGLARPEGRATLVERYRADSVTLGRGVVVETPRGRLEGTARDISAEGHLVLDTATGTEVIVSGEVIAASITSP